VIFKAHSQNSNEKERKESVKCIIIKILLIFHEYENSVLYSGFVFGFFFLFIRKEETKQNKKVQRK
jgi:hypothetical protein